MLGMFERKIERGGGKKERSRGEEVRRKDREGEEVRRKDREGRR